VREIEVDGTRLNALFDSGSRRSYINAAVAPSSRIVPPIEVGLGGSVLRLNRRCDVTARIEGLEFDVTAYVLDQSWETEHGRIDAIVGALAIQEWDIKLDMQRETLDLTGLRERTFTEFGVWIARSTENNRG
jgi:hypothetical protein